MQEQISVLLQLLTNLQNLTYFCRSLTTKKKKKWFRQTYTGKTNDDRRQDVASFSGLYMFTNFSIEKRPRKGILEIEGLRWECGHCAAKEFQDLRGNFLNRQKSFILSNAVSTVKNYSLAKGILICMCVEIHSVLFVYNHWDEKTLSQKTACVNVSAVLNLS